MKTNRNNTRVNTDAITRVLGGIVAFLGFIILLGSIGSAELELSPLKEIVLPALFGLSMFVGGVYVARLFDFQQPVRPEDMPKTAEELVGAMAYNKRHRSWMMIVDYVDDRNWTYVLCNKQGKATATPVISYRDILGYEWFI